MYFYTRIKSDILRFTQTLGQLFARPPTTMIIFPFDATNVLLFSPGDSSSVSKKVWLDGILMLPWMWPLLYLDSLVKNMFKQERR